MAPLSGGAFNVRRRERVDAALSQFSQALPSGSTAIVTDMYEPTVEVIDGEMSELGAR